MATSMRVRKLPSASRGGARGRSGLARAGAVATTRSLRLGGGRRSGQSFRVGDVVVSRASGDNEGEVVSETEASNDIKEDRSIQILKAKKFLQQQAEQKEIEKGQRTAVFTGVISLVLGVAYLFIVFLLDSRGSELKPPPPEAFL